MNTQDNIKVLKNAACYFNKGASQKVVEKYIFYN